MTTYKLGTFIRVHGSFRDHTAPGSPLADPGSVLLRVKNPVGEEQSFAPERDAEGKYHADVVAALPGRWHWRWEANGGTGVDEGHFDVSESAFG